MFFGEILMATEKSSKPQIAAGEAMGLAGLVEYGEGAVVSRTLVQNEAGTITLFAFDADQGLSEHTAPFDAFVHVLDGTGTFTIGGKPVTLQMGQIVLMPANVSHAVHATSRFKMLLTMLRSRK